MRRGTYHPLVPYLATCRADSVRLTFAEIEAILGRPLSVTAQVTPSFWKDPRSVRFVADLHRIGWEAHLEIRAHTVTFRRSSPAPKEA